MAVKTQKVELIKTWRGFAAGTVVDVQPNVAHFLIGAGTAVAARTRRRKQQPQTVED